MSKEQKMPFNDPYQNAEFGNISIRATTSGAMERLESGIVLPKLRDKPRWVSITSQNYAANNYDTKKTLIDELINLYRKQYKSSGIPEEAKYGRSADKDNPEASFRKRLDLLNMFELRDAKDKLYNTPFSEQAGYRDHIENYIQDREDDYFGEYGAYPNELGELSTGSTLYVSNVKALRIMKENGTYHMVTPHMVTVKHPKVGRVNLYLDGKKRWQVFDGVSKKWVDNGQMYTDEIVPDGYRSKALASLGIAPHVNEIISMLNEKYDENNIEDLPRTDDLQVDSIEYFNKEFNDIEHFPPKGAREGQGNVIQELLESNEQFKTSSPAAEYLAANPIVALAVFNDLSNTTSDAILKRMESVSRYSGLQIGHSDFYMNTDQLDNVIDNLEFRGDPQIADEITGWGRPTTVSGGVVTKDAMTTPEKDEFYRHFDNLYNRPKAWLQHTKDGKAVYDDEFEYVESNFDVEELVQEVGDISLRAPSLGNVAHPWMKLKEIISPDGYFVQPTDEMQENKIGMEDWNLSEILPRLHEPAIRESLSEDHLAAIDKIMLSDDAQLVFRIGDEKKNLARKLKKDTLDSLLGTPITLSPMDWKLHDESGRDDGMINSEKHGLIPLDEVNLRRNEDGLLWITGQDADGNFQMGYEDPDSREVINIEVPEVLSGNGSRSRTGKDGYVMNFDDHLDQSILDEFVKSGMLPEEYADGIKARPGSPTAPEFGSDECHVITAFISNEIRNFETQMPRGYDNEKGFYTYKLDPEDPDAELMRLTDSEGKQKSIVTEMKRKLTEFTKVEYTSEPASAEDTGREEKVTDGEPATDDKGATSDSTRSSLTDEDLSNNPRFQKYQETQQNRKAYEVLANAPLDVRVTAYRMRIQGLQDRLDESTTMGEAYDLARDWFRVGAVEYPDIVQIDRDGTSKFKKLRDAIDNTGVDWLEVNDEWVKHQAYANGHAENIDVAQEKIDYLNTTYSQDEVTRGNVTADDRKAAMELKKTFELAKRGLEEQGYPEFGSQEHVDILYGRGSNAGMMEDDADHQRRLQAYADRENTPIGEANSITSTIRGAGNSISGALSAGLATWRESRLYGLNPIAAGIHAAMSIIGEGTGMGADQIRGMDLSKPLEQMPVGYEDSGLRSYLSIGIPGTNVGKRETMYEQSRKAAARQGQPYQPPQTTTDEQEAALQRVQEVSRVTPTPAPDNTMQQTAPTGNPYTDPPVEPTPKSKPTVPTEQ